MKRKKLTCEEARNYCIVEIMENLGHIPARRTETDAWYLSPLRRETKPSFHVSTVKNKWYDHGLGKGGNVIDLVMIKNSFTVREALDFLAQDENSFYFQQQQILTSPENKVEVVKNVKISHPALITYLQERCIPLEVANEYCWEIWYRLKGKIYFAIGLQNHLGGWELRNKYYKNSTSPKSYSFLNRSSNQLIITEGMFDFLSLAVLEKELVQSSDCIILNSVSFIEKLRILSSKYKVIQTYFDNDPSGVLATEKLVNWHDQVFDKRNTYENMKDLNNHLQIETKARFNN